MPNRTEQGIVPPRDSVNNTMLGMVEETGVALVDRKSGDLVRFLPAPAGPIDRRSVRVSSITRDVPLPKSESSYLRTFGSEQATAVAQKLIGAARESVELPFAASWRGVEIESFSMGTTGNDRGRFVSSGGREELTYG